MSWLKSFSFVLALGVASVVATVNHEVTVGKDGKLLFSPESTVAQPGDTITFHFFPKNHSVTQSSFDEPCVPVKDGFFSGFVPTQDLVNPSATTWTIEVKDTKPIWVYCGQTAGNHCQSGMVYSVNPPTEGAKTLQAFKEKAKVAQSPSISPADGLPVGGLRKTSIEVGPAGTFTFAPAEVNALVGEVLSFKFNPKNHTVTQSNFDNPCQPLEKEGFSSGFVPTQVSPSGATFEITVKDTKPIWYYCAQTAGTHCQVGMVGSVNAPKEGNTFEAFKALAAKAPSSTIPNEAPLVGTLTINGTVIVNNSGKGGASAPPPSNGAPPANNNGDNKNNDTPPKEANKPIENMPAPGAEIPKYISDMAGGSQPSSYNWGATLSPAAEKLLQLLNWVDNALIAALVKGHNDLTTGAWKNLYPSTITNTIGSMGAQAIIHRSTSTDSLTHYKKDVIGMCAYTYPQSTVEEFTKSALTLVLLEIGLLLDIISSIVTTDPWMIGCLASTLGSKSRMAGMINMMQNHIPAAAPREAALPADLVYSYISTHYISDASSCPQKLDYKVWPALKVDAAIPAGADRLTEIKVDYSAQGEHWVAWIGAWGKVWYTKVESGAKAAVPVELSGHVWAVLVSKADVKYEELKEHVVAGPVMVWISQPK